VDLKKLSRSVAAFLFLLDSRVFFRRLYRRLVRANAHCL
jgi:hypothetical protein